MSVYRHKRGAWYLSVVLPTGKREQIYLGKITKDQAETIDRYISNIRRSELLGIPPSPDAIAWTHRLDAKFALRLASVGLIEATAPKLIPSVDVWLESYLADRTDYKQNTLKGWNTAKKHINAAFSGQKLTEITVADAKKYARELANRYSSEHASKLAERAKQLFQAALDAKIIAENPFSDVNITGKPDKSRDFYLDLPSSEAVLKACAHSHIAAMFCLSRWCGLRVPHEVAALKWEHIDWQNKRFTVPPHTKTGRRIVPLFGPTLEHLSKLRQDVPADSEHVFHRARRSGGTAYREWLLQAIKKAGLHGWPKLWHTLRASCRTDLEKRFAPHVCNEWLGHSSRVAAAHYLMITPEDWSEATGAQRANDAHSSAHSAERG